MSLQKYVRQLKPRTENYIPPVDKVQNFLSERIDTTLNASITELFPCLAFNKKFKPSSIEDFKKFLYTLNLNSMKSSFHSKDAASAKLVIEKLPSMDERFLKDKINNAIGITNYLYELHRTKPIKNVVWGYRAKPAGIPKNHAGDIFVFFKNGDKIGVSLKAGTTKSKEPLKNTYVGTQYKNLGVDTKSYAKALKASLREAPDVILVGEIRVRETMEAALELSNTGHLALSTLHANNAGQAIERVINMFPQSMHKQLLMDLSLNVRGIISQRLVKAKDGKRCAALEILVMTPHIQDLILKGDIEEIKIAMEESGKKGMQTFDTALHNLYKEGRIELEEALNNASSRTNLEAKINFG